MRSIHNSIYKGFPFIGTTQAAAEVEDGVVIFQREATQEFFQLLESFADLRWIGFVGFCVGFVELISQFPKPVKKIRTQ
jgi:hypothetical protein